MQERGNGGERSDRLLRALAARVRRLRENRGWSRSVLAGRSGFSLRYLAQVETGGGNLSVRRLADLADALGTTPESLIREPGSPAPVVVLVGLRGAGKSTVGPLLGRRIGAEFIEIDRRIREASGLPPDQLFELHGERYYRHMEREMLGRILDRGAPAVVAAAGGVVNEPTTWNLLLERATVVWLRARPEDHWNRVIAQGDRRPMADHPDAFAELRAILTERERLYSQAHLAVDTSRLSPAEVADRIATRLRGRSADGAAVRSAGRMAR